MSIQNGTSLTKEALEYLVGLVRDISGLDSKLIDDINLKTNGTYSSVRIESLIDKSLEEANKHTEDLISALNKLSSKKTNIQPTLENSEFNVIYLYSTDGNAPFEQYLKIGTNDSDAELINLGSTNISLDEYLTVLEASQTYTKQVDLDTTNNTLNNHINDTDIHLTEERVKEVIKSKIATTIDSSSTNDQLVGAKDMYDKLINKLDNTIILKTADEVNSFDKAYQSFIVEPSVADGIGLPNLPSSTWFCIHYSHFKGFKYPSQIAFEYAGLERIMYRTCGNGVWSDWRKVCTTSVADVSETYITSYLDETYVKPTNTNTNSYSVTNGICEVRIEANCLATTNSLTKIVSGLPKAKNIKYANAVNRNQTLNTNASALFMIAGSDLYVTCNYGDTSVSGSRGFYVSFTYPVAES